MRSIQVRRILMLVGGLSLATVRPAPAQSPAAAPAVAAENPTSGSCAMRPDSASMSGAVP